MKKRILLTVLILMAFWLSAGTVDICRVSSYEKPVFSFPVVTADDGGSGRYQGLGYSFDIEGNFLPEDEFPGVTEYTLCIFGAEVRAGMRE